MRALNIKELERLIVIMRTMQQHASSGKWQELASLDIERRALIEYDPVAKLSPANSLSAEPVRDKPDSVKNSDSPSSSLTRHQRDVLIEEIRNLDKQIITEVQDARAKLLSEKRGLNAQVTAKNLYAQTNSIT